MTTNSAASPDRRTIQPARRLRGEIWPPGDKSISHRAAMFGAVAHGRTVAENFLTGADCLSTLSVLHALGVSARVEAGDDGRERLIVEGVGRAGLREAADVLDCGNSGTSMRLLAGLLAPQPFTSILSGDASLRSRPMARVIAPLRQMGAHLHGFAGDRKPPLTIAGVPLVGIDYAMPVASAQVKSCITLAALYAEGETVIHEPAASRDHTEGLLRAMGADVQNDGLTVRVRPLERELEPLRLRVPGDISAAAFWLVAALVHPDAEITLRGVGVNHTRAGVIEVLRAMGGDIAIEEEREQGGEPVADLVARSSRLHGVTIAGEIIPRLIDEVPVLALAGALATGETRVRDAAELAVKESNRIASTARELRRFGVDVTEHDDGLTIHGRGGAPLHTADGQSEGDHRLAMMIGIAGLLARGESTINDAACARVSYPAFWDDLDRLSGAPVRT